MYKYDICGIMMKKLEMRLNIMNRNTIISLAMLYALWQSKRQDLLDLIQPFIMYAVGDTTKVGEKIDLDKISARMEEEFGYKSFQTTVVKRVLLRETSSKINVDERKIKRKNRDFYLIGDLSIQIDKFSSKRTDCKSRVDIVTKALSDFLNVKEVYNRNDYTQRETEVFLLSFFERQGSAIVSSVEDLHQITAKNNEIDFCIGKFIIAEHEKKSALMDYIVELVKGYFVTTAIYLQAENPNITTASFRDVTFYLDTRILLAFLGYKTEQENASVQEMIKSLKKNGAKLACFSYNIDEVNSILEAYKQSTISNFRRISTITLEHFDENGYTSTHVDAAQRRFKQRLEAAGINSYYPDEVLAEHKIYEIGEGLLDDARIKDILCSIKPNYNVTTLPDDLTAINTISRVRRGRQYPYIERCKAVFVTSNSLLVSATKQYLREVKCNVGFPLVITGEDLCVLAWLKDFEQSNNLPQMRLLENVLAAITPTRELMEAYFSHLDILEQQGAIDEDEAALLRVDTFARHELMELTYGEKDNLSSSVIDNIRKKIRADSCESGYKQGLTESRQKYEREKKKQKNRICKKAEDEVEEEFANKEKRAIEKIKFIGGFIAVIFVVATIISFLNQIEGTLKWSVLVVTIVTTIQAVLPFFSKDNWIIRKIKRKLKQEKLNELDRRKEKYMSLIQ